MEAPPSNFDFLRGWPEAYRRAVRAEQSANRYPEVSCERARATVEWMMNRVAGQTCGRESGLLATIDALTDYGACPEEVASAAHRVRKYGNRATHPDMPPVYAIDAKKAVAFLFEVAVWFAEGEPDSSVRVETSFQPGLVGHLPEAQERVKLVTKVRSSDVADLYRNKRLSWRQVAESAADVNLPGRTRASSIALVMVELAQWHADLMTQHDVRDHDG